MTPFSKGANRSIGYLLHGSIRYSGMKNYLHSKHLHWENFVRNLDPIYFFHIFVNFDFKHVLTYGGFNHKISKPNFRVYIHVNFVFVWNWRKLNTLYLHQHHIATDRSWLHIQKQTGTRVMISFSASESGE